MKKIIILTAVISLFLEVSKAQTGIGLKLGNSSGTKASSALLELESTSAGLLLPRMTTSQRNSIANPINGLTVFSTDNGSLDVLDNTNSATWNRFGGNTNIFRTGAISSIALNTYGTTLGSTLNLFNSRGTLAAPNNLAVGDPIGRMVFGGQAGGAMRDLASIASNYRGNGTTQAADMSFNIGSTTPMFISETGNVGIGTTQPFSHLTVSRLTTALRIEDLNADPNTGLAATSSLVFGTRGGDGNPRTLASIGYDYFDPGTLNISNFLPGKTVNISVDSTVSTTPSTLTNLPTLRLIRNGTYTLDAIGAITSVFKYPAAADFALGSFSTRDSSTTSLSLKLGNGETFTPEVDVMTFYSDKRVGVGTTTPSSSLHIDGTLALNTGNTTNSSIILAAGGTVTLPAANTVSGRVYIIRNTATGTTNVTVASIIDFNSATSNTFTLTPAIGSIMIVSNGTNWFRIR